MIELKEINSASASNLNSNLLYIFAKIINYFTGLKIPFVQLVRLKESVQPPRKKKFRRPNLNRKFKRHFFYECNHCGFKAREHNSMVRHTAIRHSQNLSLKTPEDDIHWNFFLSNPQLSQSL